MEIEQFFLYSRLILDYFCLKARYIVRHEYQKKTKTNYQLKCVDDKDEDKRV